MTTRAQAAQQQISKQREAILARARQEVEAQWAELEVQHAEDAAISRATVEVYRERQARKEPSSSPLDIVSEEDSQVTKQKERSVSGPRPNSAAGRARAKGQAGLQAAQAHRATKKAQAGSPVASSKVKRSTSVQAIKAGPPAGAENGKHGPNGEHFTKAKADGARIVKGNRGGFDVKVIGGNNRALRGLFETEKDAQDAATTAGLTIKATPKK